jgi:26S proteasome regulatory subunit T3
MLGVDEKPDVTYADVGGLDMQKQEIREAVELPLTHFDLYKQIGKLHLEGAYELLLTSTRY